MSSSATGAGWEPSVWKLEPPKAPLPPPPNYTTNITQQRCDVSTSVSTHDSHGQSGPVKPLEHLGYKVSITAD